MNFKKLKIKPAYDSREDDVVNSFYIPVLSHAKEYYRLCGFFSSSSLAVAAKGISKLIKNNGKMRIVASPKLSKEDIKAIVEGHKQIEKVIEERLLTELSDFENEIVKDHVRALAWMVAHKKLEIKVAVTKSSEGVPLDHQVLDKRGIFHQKVGILKDSEGNMLSFSGSINETATGWLENIEEFKVFRDWMDGEISYLSNDVEKFKKYWLGEGKRTETISIPLAVEKKLIQIAPPNISELKLVENFQKRVPIFEAPKLMLRDYQQKAMQSWLSNDYKGILEMATGTGKTYVGIKCIEDLFKKRGKLAVIVTVPTIHLINQWKRKLEEFGYRGVKIFGSFSQWEKRMMTEIDDFKLGYLPLSILITTHDTFCSQNFVDAVSSLENEEVLLLADEVHGIGAPQRSTGLLETYKCRLGLSATPERWFDETGTKILENFFGEVVFRYPIKDAIRDGWLSPYEYYPIFIELEDDEFNKYVKATKKIARLYHSLKDDKKKEEIITNFLISRRNILKNAGRKLGEFEKLVSQISEEGEFHHCLVYCSSDSPRQIRNAQEILNRLGVLQHKFTAMESAQEREKILQLFKSKKYQTLVAMKCLDEGVDIPSTRIAIILSSTTNPREFIQRRGRILRRVIGKKAIVYDFIVVPTLYPDPTSEYYELERKIFKQELRRYLEFASASLNSGFAYEKINSLREKFNL